MQKQGRAGSGERKDGSRRNYSIAYNWRFGTAVGLGAEKWREWVSITM
jgi:hypothetical protein